MDIKEMTKDFGRRRFMLGQPGGRMGYAMVATESELKKLVIEGAKILGIKVLSEEKDAR